MKLKEKLSKEYQQHATEDYQFVPTSDVQDAYLAGFEKARDMLLEIHQETVIDCHDAFTPDQIVTLGEEEIP